MLDTVNQEASGRTGPPVPEDRLVSLPPGTKPILCVVCDTEEEFDWSQPHDRGETGVAAMAHVGRGQAVFDDYGIRPCYVSDYPVVSQPEGSGPLKEIHQDGRCIIGAHLHPWVNPPHAEKVCRRLSFPGNLPESLEEEKLRVLNDKIGEVFGEPATVYKAGRYGLGPHTEAILGRLGFDVDVSVLPDFDYSHEEGPDFQGFPYGPYWFGGERRSLAVPCTAALTGSAGGLRHDLYHLAYRPLPLRLHAPGIIARLGLADRLQLSNENYTFEENVKLTRWLYDRGVRVFSYTFHSPSLKPGCTPYVRTEADLRGFLDQFRRYFDWFFGELNGVTMTPLQVRDHCIKETIS